MTSNNDKSIINNPVFSATVCLKGLDIKNRYEDFCAFVEKFNTIFKNDISIKKTPVFCLMENNCANISDVLIAPNNKYYILKKDFLSDIKYLIRMYKVYIKGTYKKTKKSDKQEIELMNKGYKKTNACNIDYNNLSKLLKTENKNIFELNTLLDVNSYVIEKLKKLYSEDKKAFEDNSKRLSNMDYDFRIKNLKETKMLIIELTKYKDLYNRITLMIEKHNFIINKINIISKKLKHSNDMAKLNEENRKQQNLIYLICKLKEYSSVNLGTI